MKTLVSMTEGEFQMFLAYSIQEYAQNKVVKGQWNEEEAPHKAEQQYQQILPQGLQTPTHYFWMVMDQQLAKKVGIVWFALREQDGEQQALVYDVKIFEEFRSRGYVTHASQLLAKKAAELGATTVSVRIFGHNLATREMYEKLGYVVTDTSITKKLTNHLHLQK